MKIIKLIEMFEANKDEENAIKMAAYMRNQFSFFGIATPKRVELTKAFLKEYQKDPKIDWSFVFACYDHHMREMQYVAINYLTLNKKYLTSNDIDNLKHLITTKSWWDTIDGIDKIVGAIALSDSSVNQTLLAWSVDDNFWLRRIAIDHQLGRKDKTNCELLEKIIVNNFGQTEFFINKAIGWALREYSKTNPEWVANFIYKYQKQLAKLSYKEASKYLK